MCKLCNVVCVPGLDYPIWLPLPFSLTFLFVPCLVHIALLVSLDCKFLIALSIFSGVYYVFVINMISQRQYFCWNFYVSIYYPTANELSDLLDSSLIDWCLTSSEQFFSYIQDDPSSLIDMRKHIIGRDFSPRTVNYCELLIGVVLRGSQREEVLSNMSRPHSPMDMSWLTDYELS